MIKCEVTKDFTLEEFDKLQNIKRRMVEQKGKLFIGDTFECDEKMAKYLTGNNEKKEIVIKLIEVEPECKNAKEVKVEVIKPKKKGKK